MDYGQYVSYSVAPGSLSSSESATAQQVLSPVAPSNSTLVVVYQPKGEPIGEVENRTLSFQRALNATHIPFVSGSNSVFSSYEVFLSELLSKNVVTGMRETYYNFTSLSSMVYVFPSEVLGNWSRYGYSPGSLAQAESDASAGASRGYDSLFLADLNDTLAADPSASPAQRVQNATASAALSYFFDLYPFLIFPVVNSTGYNVTDYSTDALGPVSSYLSAYSGVHISTQLLDSALVAGNNASEYYFSEYGLLGLPSFISQEHVSPDGSTYLVNVDFNVTDSYRGPGGFYPAQSATPEVRSLAQEYLGGAQVTGEGAVATDTAQASASAGYAFALIFLFLAVAVGLLFRAYIPPILALVIVSLATALGYVAIFITGLAIVRVDYVVTDVLTAVVLGVSTDYLVFILARYREELGAGRPSSEALATATSKAGFAVIVSGLTVAVGLGAISLVSGLQSWGPVLSMTILLTVALETTLVPAALSLVGPRVFAGVSLRGRVQGRSGTRPPPAVERSRFYRAAKFSQRRKLLVVGVVALLALPSAFLWFTLPTTYNINEGLPQGSPSVQALNLVDQKFGSSVIYPVFVAVAFDQNATSGGGGLTAAATSSLEADAKVLLDTPGVKQVFGPTINGSRIQPSSLDSQFVFDRGSDAYFVVFTDYNPYSGQAISVVEHLRQDGQFLVGGLTSSIVDQEHYYTTAFDELEVVILFAIALVLGLAFRSAKYPFIALTGVFVSIAWTTAILYVIVRYVLDQEMVFLVPIVLFVILMSLGNDFAVFIFSRAREEQKALGFDEGLARAMVGSGAVVTALGLILAASLGSLGLVPFGYLEQLGIAFAISLLLDTFVIRTFYFPSMLFLLEPRQLNWARQRRKESVRA